MFFYGRRTKSEIITNGEIVSELHFLIRSITSRQGFGSAFFVDPEPGKNLHAELDSDPGGYPGGKGKKCFFYFYLFFSRFR